MGKTVTLTPASDYTPEVDRRRRMTLLIATLSTEHALLTADGLCRGGGRDSSTLQKIFPMAGVPIAFAHHGLNILGSRPVAALLEEFMALGGLVPATASVGAIARELQKRVEGLAAAGVAQFPAFGVGFWMVGFDAGHKNPKLYEVYWPDHERPCRRWPWVLAGEGAKYIRDRAPGFDSSCSEEYARDYHNTLYAMALSEQERLQENVFGGRRHRLAIRPSGCEWTEPPECPEAVGRSAGCD